MPMIDKFANIAEVATAYRKGEISPVEIVESYLSRIEKLEPKLGAFEVVFSDRALDAAKAAENAIRSGHRIGLFHGIPFALKDIIDVEGCVTTGGSMAMQNRVAQQTAKVAQRLISAGGILIGKTKTVEVAYGAWGTNQHRGTPRNPWDMDIHRTPGGSSSGSAVAVASGLVPCAIGTDTGGSVRVPAAWCGIVGLKVTEGLIPTEGILPLSHTLDTPGPLARNLTDTVIAFDVMNGRSSGDIRDDFNRGAGIYYALQEGAKGLRVGILSDSERDGVDKDILELYDRSLDQLRQIGVETIAIDPPLTFEEIKDAVGTIISSEGYYYNGELYEDPANQMDDDVRPRIITGKEISSRRYIEALVKRKVHQQQLNERMRGIAAILTPTVPTAAIPIDDVDQKGSPTRFTRFGNYFTMCGISIPMGLTNKGLPAGLQILAPSLQEATAIRIGAAYEAARGPAAIPEI